MTFRDRGTNSKTAFSEGLHRGAAYQTGFFMNEFFCTRSSDMPTISVFCRGWLLNVYDLHVK